LKERSAKVRTRVSRERRNKDKWQWWIFDGDYSEQQGGYESREAAKAALAARLAPHDAEADRHETERQFMRDAF
jgi:hypothetical protein